MREIKNVMSTTLEVQSIEFGTDTVYVRENIAKIEDRWFYDEKQYTFQEWSDIQDKKIKTLEEDVHLTQIALNEIIMSKLMEV